MRGGQGARQRRPLTRPALGRVSGRIGGSRTVVGCITRRRPRDAVVGSAFTAAIYEFATHRRCGFVQTGPGLNNSR